MLTVNEYFDGNVKSIAFDGEDLATQGVGRIILPLPTLAEGEALSVLDEYAELVSWSKSIA